MAITQITVTAYDWRCPVTECDQGGVVFLYADAVAEVEHHVRWAHR